MLPGSLEYIAQKYKDVSMKNTAIIARQHVLSTHVTMFDYFHHRHGLSPDNTYILGKAYSTSLDAFREFERRGIHVDNNSFTHDSHRSFDEVSKPITERFLERSLLRVLQNPGVDTVVILDDGGELLTHAKPIRGIRMFGVEQTSSGYDRIKWARSVPRIPLYNVARCETKLEKESPQIACQIAEALHMTSNEPGEDILILGAGALGVALYRHFNRSQHRVTLYDSSQPIIYLNNRPTSIPVRGSEPLENILGNYSLILGATGKTSLPAHLHKHVADGAVLASVSSSDREFEAYRIREKFPPSDDVHEDYFGRFTLRNGGYPVNFDGKPINVPLEDIQITLGLLYGSICEGHLGCSANYGFIDVPDAVQEDVRRGARYGAR